MIFIGLNFALLLGFVKNVNRPANQFLALALVIIVVWMMRILAIDIRLETYLPGWDRLPMQFLLAIGPLIYFYVRKITQPQYQLRWKDLLHFSPLLLEQAALVLEIKESVRTGTETYTTPVFPLLNFVLQLLIFISIISYLYHSHRLIQKFYRQLQPVLMDRSLLEFKWLRRLLAATALLWLLWIGFAALDYLWYHGQLGIHVYYPFYIYFAVILIWTAVAAFLRPQAGLMAQTSAASKSSPPAELRDKGAWLKKTIEANKYYQDPDASLSSLAEKLGLTVHELSRIINTVLKKSFNDFVNEYRVIEVIRKMQDPTYNRLSLLGIAFDSGFNSKTTFSRAFRRFTGKTPGQYSGDLKKEGSSYKMNPYSSSSAIISCHEAASKWSFEKSNRTFMFKNYLKIAWRNLFRNKASSFINIGGLAVGMAVAMLIGLWIWDELSFDRYHQNYARIAQIKQNKTTNGDIVTGDGTSLPVVTELRKSYGGDFKHIAVTFWHGTHILSAGEKNISFGGRYVDSEFPVMFSLKMLRGNYGALKGPSSLLLSESTAKILFGDADPMNKVVKMDNQAVFQVGGVYQDLPENTTFHDEQFLAPWDYYVTSEPWLTRAKTDWSEDSFPIYVQVADHIDIKVLSAKIKNIKIDKGGPGEVRFKAQLLLFPMNRWHLYGEFKNGVNTGGAIQYVWLFGLVGIFVLLLACINFMNLSTARSEKRAKEVGIRKAVGSVRSQLIGQFFSESLLIAFSSFLLSLILVWLTLPFFNEIANKHLSVLWGRSAFWLLGFGFALFTGLIAGTYPALYLSSFNPVKVLKGTFKAGRLASVPRKVLVVTQFAISVTLIIGTIVIFKQVRYVKDRPIGYSRRGLITMETTDTLQRNHFRSFRADLLRTGAVSEVSGSLSPLIDVHNRREDVSWSGKDPAMTVDFNYIQVTYGFGKTVGWNVLTGRDFSDRFVSDAAAVILNEAAVKYMGLKEPVGQVIKESKINLTVIGVVKDMVMQSPYEPVKPTLFSLTTADFDYINLRINPNVSAHDAISKIAPIWKQYSPSAPFAYKFTDDEYAKKFATEERIGKLSGAFATLAIFISCLGLFGMASFMAEQRVKEIGVRKVLGASVFGIWRLMSTDFAVLVGIALLVAAPVGYVFMRNWLQHYTYHTGMSWWIFAATAVGAMLVTLLTVSYQSIKTALANPVKSLRSE